MSKADESIGRQEDDDDGRSRELTSRTADMAMSIQIYFLLRAPR
jgi:hypothetical protein